MVLPYVIQTTRLARERCLLPKCPIYSYDTMSPKVELGALDLKCFISVVVHQHTTIQDIYLLNVMCARKYHHTTTFAEPNPGIFQSRPSQKCTSHVCPGHICPQTNTHTHTHLIKAFAQLTTMCSLQAGKRLDSTAWTC